MFTLEALPAKNGDCLLLHFGNPADPRLVLIDCGPGGVFANALEPRLQALKTKLGATDPLSLELVLVSHIDDDHIAGIQSLLTQLDKARSAGKPEAVRVGQLWHNAFEAIVDQPAPSSLAQQVVERLDDAGEGARAGAITASIGQGTKVAKLAAKLGIARNGGQPLVTDGLKTRLVDGRPGGSPDGLVMEAIGPNRAEIDALREEWAKQLKVPVSDIATASKLDKSAANLSSLVTIATYGGRSMLLTGDALGANIVTALGDAGKLDATGRVHFDILKVPHHGSDFNVTEEFFATVTADNYVISGNGVHGNPEPASLQMLADARGDDDYTLWCTYSAGDPNEKDAKDLEADLLAWSAAQAAAGRPSKLVGPAVNGVSSLVVDLDPAEPLGL